MTIFSKNLGGMALLAPPGYAYALTTYQTWQMHTHLNNLP